MLCDRGGEPDFVKLVDYGLLSEGIRARRVG